MGFAWDQIRVSAKVDAVIKDGRAAAMRPLPN